LALDCTWHERDGERGSVVGEFRQVSVESTLPYVAFQDDVGYGIEHKLNIGSVRGARKVRVNFFLVFPFVKALEFVFNVCPCMFVCVWSCSAT